jgi:hypothetical protein
MPSFLQRFVATFWGSLNGKLKTKPETVQGKTRAEQFEVSDGNFWICGFRRKP